MKFVGQRYSNAVIETDGNQYENCKFDHCTLQYSGGALPSIFGCTLIETGFSFTGPAGNTLELLQAMYHGGFRSVVENTIDQIAGKELRLHSTS